MSSEVETPARTTFARAMQARSLSLASAAKEFNNEFVLLGLKAVAVRRHGVDRGGRPTDNPQLPRT